MPDITQQAEKPKVCTQDLDSVDMPREYTKLFKHDLYSINLDMVPAALKAYDELNVKHEPLSLIAPNFETPLPQTQASVSIRYFHLRIHLFAFAENWNRENVM